MKQIFDMIPNDKILRFVLHLYAFLFPRQTVIQRPVANLCHTNNELFKTHTISIDS